MTVCVAVATPVWSSHLPPHPHCRQQEPLLAQVLKSCAQMVVKVVYYSRRVLRRHQTLSHHARERGCVSASFCGLAAVFF